MDFRRRQRRRTQKKKRLRGKTRQKRQRHVSKPPNLVHNVSPVSSPGPNSPSFSLSPNSSPNTPITKRAKQLATLYPDTRTMVKRSQSFNSANNMTTEEFYRQLERLFPNQNGPQYH